MLRWNLHVATEMGVEEAPAIPTTFEIELPDADRTMVWGSLRSIESLTMYFDAGTRGGNPGESGIAVYAELESDEHFTYYLRVTELVGVMTNNEAEWRALLLALRICQDHAPALRYLYLRSDSKLVVHQARGQWRVRGHLRHHYEESLRMAQSLSHRGVRVEIGLVPREENREADRLVTQLLDEHLGRKRGY
jgi:ribonuclease HI